MDRVKPIFTYVSYSHFHLASKVVSRNDALTT